MDFHLSDALRTARLQLTADAMSGGTLTLYTDPRPAIGGALTTQAAVAQFTLPEGLTVSSATLSITPPNTTVLVSATPTWGRIVSASDAFVADGSVGLLTDTDSPFLLPTLSLSATGILTPTVFVITEP